jgi:dTDP-4-amino-4,6-dideoxygalactose transaminase
MNIPFVNLKAQYSKIKTEIDESIKNVIEDTAFIRGEYVEKFEKDFSKVYGVKHVVSCANGTDAIYISLKALGIGIGDEVITTASSWISTSETISQTGAKVVFVDIDPNHYVINPDKIEEAITKNTKAIIPVHLYGHPANMTKILKIAKKYNIQVIEDCAQAHFSTWNKKNVGTYGIAGTFSFYPGKNLGAYGDAGCIISDDHDFAKKAKMYANHGALKKHFHDIEGINSRMDGIQASILSVKLRYINEWTALRQENAKLYDNLLSPLQQVITPYVDEKAQHVYHLYVIRTKNRESLVGHLKSKNISTSIHYPTPLPFLKAYDYLNHTKEQFPVVFKQQKEILSIPMFPELSVEEIKYVVNSINQFFKK